LTTSNAEGVPVRLLVYEHGEAEADGIAREIRRLVDSGKQRWSDFAVFYRVNALSRLFETTFSRYEVPCQIAAGYSFFERAEVRDLIAWLRLIENDADDSALERIINRPARGIGSASLLKVRRYAALHGLSIFAAARQCASIDGLTARVRKSLEGFVDLIERLQRQSAAGLVGPLLERLIDEIDYLSLWRQEEDEVDVDREANIHELISAARHYDSGAGSLFSGRAMSGEETGTEGQSEPLEPPSLQGFLEQATLSSEVDKVDPAKGAVTLMTLHASKGLEYPCVYIAGLENGLIPHERAIRDGDPSSLEEERRLLYVGITRAREHLTLTQTSERVFRGMRRTTISSPFAGEISQELDRGAAQSTPAALALAGMDDRLEAARRRFEAARSSGQRPLLMKGSQLKAEREVPEGDRTDDPSTVPSFRRGMMVRHPRYGTGIVTEVGGASHRATVTVHFEGADDTQTFVASRCPLQPAFPGVSGDGED
jgi:DNA helicase-2/ATP-dependent DNA helicase PcrA